MICVTCRCLFSIHFWFYWIFVLNFYQFILFSILLTLLKLEIFRKNLNLVMNMCNLHTQMLYGCKVIHSSYFLTLHFTQDEKKIFSCAFTCVVPFIIAFKRFLDAIMTVRICNNMEHMGRYE